MAQDMAVIFDMDGVILDSERLAMIAWKKVGAERGLEHIDRVLEECTGINETVAQVTMRRHYGSDFDYQEWKRTVNAVRLEICGGVIPPKKGARELLDWLRDNGVPRALASSTRSDIVESELTDSGLIDGFDVLICGDMVKASKPEPDIFLTAAKALAAIPENCYVVEDSPNGLRAAYAAGMHPILVPDRMPVTAEMRGLAEYTCPSLLEVRDLLRTVLQTEKDSHIRHAENIQREEET